MSSSMDYAGSQIRDTIDRPVTLSETRSPDVAIHVRRHSIGQVLEVRFGFCVTSITGPNGGAELYER
jgi:hypothetical protein